MADPTDGEAPIYEALGEMLVKWNHAESLMRFLVVWLYDLGDKGDILTAHMGSRTLADAMNTLAEEFSDDVLRPHLRHFVNYLDTVRAYRNYYAHGIALVGFDEAGEPVGTLQETQARGQLLFTQEHITANNIKEVTAFCQTAVAYGSAIISEILHRQGLGGGAVQPIASREKPLLPPQLKKPRLRLMERRGQSQSAPE